MVKAAVKPPGGLPGLQPEWSRIVSAGDHDWHVLERPAVGPAELTVIAVHGNPTWSYLWRNFLRLAPESWRVIAIDQLSMGYSERSEPRRLAERIDDLGALTDAMQVRGPVMTVAHDWGGPVSLGWALAHQGDLRGVVLFNTAVHQPKDASAPRLIRAARWGPLHDLATRRSSLFVRGTSLLSRFTSSALPRDAAAAYFAPYVSADRRQAVADFVADIPLDAGHPSAATLNRIADEVGGLQVPVLLAWGVDDPVFSDVYLRDLMVRLPHADVHRYEKAGHLVTEDAPGAISDAIAWMQAQGTDSALQGRPRGEADPTTAETTDRLMRVRRSDLDIALVDMASQRSVSWHLLTTRVEEIAAGLVCEGVARGDRVAMLIPPGPDLVAAIYACWRLGAIVVVADSGLGVGGMRRAIRGAHVDHVIAISAGLGLARTLRISGLRVLAGAASVTARRALGADTTLSLLAAAGRRAIANGESIEPPGPTDQALIAFTSGSTGPAKGVVYTHGRLTSLCAVLSSTYDLQPGRDGLVAAFAPWAVLGPALGIGSAIPNMDITDPSTLTMDSFSAAANAIGGTIAWTSPTGLRALIDTANDTTQRPDELRQLLVAGAPVPLGTLKAAADALPDTRIATPYGMTEALPLTQVDLGELIAAQPESGVLVGQPLEGVDVRIAPLTHEGIALAPESSSGVTGEIVVNADWIMAGYDRRWAQQFKSRTIDGAHRTGDVGHLDAQGRLWVEGRLAHVITTSHGPLTPVAIETIVAEVAGTALSACVGVGPAGRQVVVVVIPDGGGSMRVADVDLTMTVRTAVRESTGVEIAAVLLVSELPVDVRHRSKINRARVARRAAELLAGSADRGATS